MVWENRSMNKTSVIKSFVTLSSVNCFCHEASSVLLGEVTTQQLSFGNSTKSFRKTFRWQIGLLFFCFYSLDTGLQAHGQASKAASRWGQLSLPGPQNQHSTPHCSRGHPLRAPWNPGWAAEARAVGPAPERIKPHTLHIRGIGELGLLLLIIRLRISPEIITMHNKCSNVHLVVLVETIHVSQWTVMQSFTTLLFHVWHQLLFSICREPVAKQLPIISPTKRIKYVTYRLLSLFGGAGIGLSYVSVLCGQHVPHHRKWVSKASSPVCLIKVQYLWLDAGGLWCFIYIFLDSVLILFQFLILLKRILFSLFANVLSLCSVSFPNDVGVVLFVFW